MSEDDDTLPATIPLETAHRPGDWYAITGGPLCGLRLQLMNVCQTPNLGEILVFSGGTMSGGQPYGFAVPAEAARRIEPRSTCWARLRLWCTLALLRLVSWCQAEAGLHGAAEADDDALPLSCHTRRRRLLAALRETERENVTLRVALFEERKRLAHYRLRVGVGGAN